MRRPPVLMPDAVAVVVDYLRPALAAAGRPVPVGSRVPDPRPGEFVVVQRLGGYSRPPVVDSARIDTHAWAASEEAAADLAQLVRALITAIPGVRSGVTVYRVQETAAPMWLPDPVSGAPRYAYSALIDLRGTPL